MGALDYLNTASFRGVTFDVDDRTYDSGRRGETSEQPHSDTPYSQDTGRRARSFRVVALVNCTYSTLRRDSLRAALEKYGPGRYVDPWGDQWRVKVARYTVRESTRRANFTEFQIEFVEDGVQPTAVLSRADTSAGLLTSATSLFAAAASAFRSGFSYSGVPEFVRAAGPMVAANFGDVLSSASDWGVSAADSLGLSDAVETLTGGASADELVSGVQGGISAASVIMPTTSARTNFLLTAASYRLDPDELTWSTQHRALAAQNQVATAALIRRSALAELTQNTSSVAFDSYEAAQDYTALIGDAFDEEIALAGGNVAGESSFEVFGALNSARSAVVTDVSARGADLAHLTTVTLTGEKPAVVEAYRMYDDATRAGDIAARNGVTDPNSLPAGSDMEYLSK